MVFLRNRQYREFSIYNDYLPWNHFRFSPIHHLFHESTMNWLSVPGIHYLLPSWVFFRHIIEKSIILKLDRALFFDCALGESLGVLVRVWPHISVTVNISIVRWVNIRWVTRRSLMCLIHFEFEYPTEIDIIRIVRTYIFTLGFLKNRK